MTKVQWKKIMSFKTNFSHHPLFSEEPDLNPAVNDASRTLSMGDSGLAFTNLILWIFFENGFPRFDPCFMLRNLGIFLKSTHCS